MLTRIPACSHKTLTRTIRDWALIYEFPGSDPSLKPLFLAAHQDVVPVLPSTLSQWKHPPFSGKYDGTYIWGRGASDTKGSLIALMVAIEYLLETTEWRPQRTVVLGFGSDEERGGQVSLSFPTPLSEEVYLVGAHARQIGAPAISQYLTEKYGKDSMSLYNSLLLIA